MTKQSEKPTLAPVEKTKAKPAEVRSAEETVAMEARTVQTDQIPDYHDENPTLKAEGPQYDPEVLRELNAEALKANAPTKAEVKDAAAEVKGGL